MRWILVALWCALWCSTAATCGQKGPLYLPEERPRPEERPPADSFADAVDRSARAAPGAHAAS